MKKLISDFGSGVTLDPRVVRKAAIACVLRACDEEDAITMMDILGIIPPQPGNEIADKRTFKNEQTRETRKVRRELLKELKAKKKEEDMSRLGITPEEIGE